MNKFIEDWKKDRLKQFSRRVESDEVKPEEEDDPDGEQDARDWNRHIESMRDPGRYV